MLSVYLYYYTTFIFYEVLYYSVCLVFQYTHVSGFSSIALASSIPIHVKLKGSMDLGTNYYYAGSAPGSALSGHLHKALGDYPS